MLLRAGRFALDFLLPPTCLTCDALVGQPGLLCASCFSTTGFITDPCCVGCGAPFEPGQTDGLCAECRASPPPWERGRAALRYDAQARRLVLPLKYGDRLELAPGVAGMMYRAGVRLVREADVLVPVPLHRMRLFRRRYNQAALLARAVARLGGKPAVLDALLRTRRTRPLADLSATARASEMDNAIAIRPSRREAIAGRRVLLVDDVMTSGATARACTEALLAGGAAAVDVLIAARVTDPRRH